jgi:PAS domain S-box-containing protein
MSAIPDIPPDEAVSYQQMFHANPQSMWIYAQDTLQFLDVNAAAVERYGYTRDEFLHMTIADIRPPHELEAMYQAVRDARARESVPVSGPWHHYTKSGESLFARTSSHGLVYQGRDARLVLVIDITRQVAMEAEREAMIAALRKSQERLDAAITGGNVGLWERDLIDRTLTCGGRWADILGTTPEAFGPVTVQNFFALCHPDDVRPSHERLLAFLRHPAASYSDEFRMRHASGRWIWVMSRGRIAEFTPDGQARRMVGTLVDITDLKAAQAAREQQRAAEQASAMKSQFLARVSHELRTPLNAVLGFAQLLQLDMRVPLTPDQRERVRFIEQAGQHLLELITDLMDLSRIEVDAVDLQSVPVDVDGLISDCVQMVDTQVRERGLHVERSIDTPSAWALADPLRLRQCVLNLLSNAIKYNRPGGTVRVGLAADGAKHLSVSVWNTGDGLDSAQLQRLYEPFNRLGRDAGPEGGTGIGLAITRQLIERMGGRIDAAGAPGEWARFTLTMRSAG